VSFLATILAAWRDPRRALRDALAGGAREDRALACLMVAAALIFLAQLPVAARDAVIAPSAPFEARLAGALMAVVFLLPLLAYAVAAASHLVARIAGGRGSWFGARMALFQALLAVAPVNLVHGILRGMTGDGIATQMFGVAAFGAFLYLWLGALSESESGRAPQTGGT
jgi:hypothetical protein